jgi:hypothetical protein
MIEHTVHNVLYEIPNGKRSTCKSTFLSRTYFLLRTLCIKFDDFNYAKQNERPNFDCPWRLVCVQTRFERISSVAAAGA